MNMKDDQIVRYCPPPVGSVTEIGTWRDELAGYLAPGVPATHATFYPTMFTHVGAGEYAARALPVYPTAQMLAPYWAGMNPQYDLWLANAMRPLTEEELNARHLQLAAAMQNVAPGAFLGFTP
jgi:hypothetical protein